MSVEKITVQNCSEEKPLIISKEIERLREFLTYPEIGIFAFLCTMPNQTCTKEEIYQSSQKDSKQAIDQVLLSLKQKNIISIIEVE